MSRPPAIIAVRVYASRYSRVRGTDRAPAEGDRRADDDAADAGTAAVDREPAPSDRVDPRRSLPVAHAVATRPRGAPPEPAHGARLRRAAVHRVHRDQRRP